MTLPESIHNLNLSQRARVPLRIAAACLVGLLFLVAAVMFYANLMAEAQKAMGIPDSAPSDIGPTFTLPAPHRKEPAPWWADAPPARLGDSARVNAQQREAQLTTALAPIVKEKVPPNDIVVSQARGVTTVGTSKQELITVLKEDLPDYADQLRPEARKALELQVANSWRHQIQDYLQDRYREDEAGFLRIVAGACSLIFLSGLAFHYAVDLFGRHFLDSPFWSMKALLWALVLSLMASIVPGASILERALGHSAIEPLMIFIALNVSSSIANLLGGYFIDRYFDALRETQRFQTQERRYQRLRTLKQASKFVWRLINTLIWALVFAHLVGVDLQPLVAGAGMIGVAITWIGQDMFRDFIAGLNILVEDQYGVGDYIEVQSVSGRVEAFTLRSTRIRSDDGSLWTLPNSELKRVRNLTTGWSQVDFRVTLASQSDSQACLDILEEELDGLRRDLPDLVLEVPELLGVESMGPDGLVLRALVRTGPGDQFALRRTINARLKKRFEAEGIQFPSSSPTIIVQAPTASKPAPES